MNYLLITRDALDIGSIIDLASSGYCGATSLFIGTTHEDVEGRHVLSVEYGACEHLAENEMENICGELRFRWSDIGNIVIYHRIGVVPLGEASVVIAISSPQGKSALEAVPIVIDELKKRVPIWKKEQCGGSEYSTWKDNSSATFDARLCDIQDDSPLPQKFVQISASETEIDRRIERFIERKREEIDLNNIADYINPCMGDAQADSNPDSFTSCARIEGTVVKQENSKCHLKVRKIDNKMGPQMQHDYLYTLDNLMETQLERKIKQENNDDNLHVMTKSAALQRAENIEEYLNVSDNNKKNIHQRLKYLEDRLLYLESISPEYHHNLCGQTRAAHSCPTSDTNSAQSKAPSHRISHRKVYGVEDINRIIEKESQNI